MAFASNSMFHGRRQQPPALVSLDTLGLRLLRRGADFSPLQCAICGLVSILLSVCSY